MLPILIVPDSWYGKDAFVGDVVRRVSAPGHDSKDRPTAGTVRGLAAALQASVRRTADLCCVSDGE